MGLTAAGAARLVGGELHGSGDTVIEGMAPLDRAGPRHVSFVANRAYAVAAGATRAGVLIVPPELAEVAAANSSVAATIVVARPHDAILTLIPELHDVAPPRPGVASTARLGRGVELGAGVHVGEHVVLGDGVRVGDGTVLHPSVTAYAGTVIGARCVIHSGVRLGSDGFGFVQRDGAHVKIPHVGRCLIGDDVEIGANTTIDRGSVADTVIGAGTKIDNLVQIGHNVHVGKGCLIMAQAGISGSTRIGDGVIVAGQAGIAGHVTIGAGARIAAQAGVFGDVPAGESWSGYPARPHRESLRASAALFRLAGMMRALEDLVATHAGKRPSGEGDT